MKKSILLLALTMLFVSGCENEGGIIGVPEFLDANAGCQLGTHDYKGECEDDSVKHCGSHGNSCLSLDGWEDGDCFNGECIASECEDGYELFGNVCQPKDEEKCADGEYLREGVCSRDTVEHCGSGDVNCVKAEGWADGECIGGQCL